MYPDPNQQQPYSPGQTPSGQPQQYSIDYLNQIAPQAKKPGRSNKLFLLIIGGGLLLAVIFGLYMLMSSGSSSPKQKMQTLAARLQTLQTISDKAQPNIKSNVLRSTNSNLDIFLTNANRDIVDPLKKSGIDIKKLDKTIVAAEKHDDLTTKLEDARLNAVYDRTYAREMGYQLSTVEALMKDIYAHTNSKSMKDFLVETDQNVTPIIKQLNDFNAAND